jgi:hypothetical protein
MAKSKLRSIIRREMAQAERKRSPAQRVKESLSLLSAARKLFESGLRLRGFTQAEISALWRNASHSRAG